MGSGLQASHLSAEWGNGSQWQLGFAGKFRKHSWDQNVTGVLWIVLEEKNLCVRGEIRRKTRGAPIQEDVSDVVLFMV